MNGEFRARLSNPELYHSKGVQAAEIEAPVTDSLARVLT